MKRNPGFTLQKIEDIYYLLPYGQLIADHKRGVSLNETGAYIWNLLEVEMPREELLSKCINHFSEESPPDFLMKEVLDQFLNQLISRQFIEDDTPASPGSGEPCTYLRIGGLALAVYAPKEFFNATHLRGFCVENSGHVDQTVSVIWGAPISHISGTILIHNNDLVVCERENDYFLLFPGFTQIFEASLSKDGKQVFFYCEPIFTEDLWPDLFHAMRLTFLYLAQKHNMYAIHSASILYQNKAWLFSGVSGTGKSTHTNLWNRLYQTAILNGDLNLLAFDDGKYVVHGIPWCGTSEMYTTKTVPLGGIILLKQSKNDTLVELSPDKKALLTAQRFISPIWTKENLANSLQFTMQLAGQVLIGQLFCTKNDSAVDAVKNWIDKNQEGNC